jgi:hypothetical protein
MANSHPPKLVAPADPAPGVDRLVDEGLPKQKRLKARSGCWPRANQQWRIAVPKQEQLFFGGCLLMFWLINAASLSGYVIMALFVLVAIGRLVRNAVAVLAAKLPRRSQIRHYLILGISVVFFSLLAIRGCYLAAVIVDTQFRSDPFQVPSSSGRH